MRWLKLQADAFCSTGAILFEFAIRQVDPVEGAAAIFWMGESVAFSIEHRANGAKSSKIWSFIKFAFN